MDYSKADEQIKNGFPDLEILSVEGISNGFIINWGCRYIGFGQLTFWVDKDNRMHTDTEGMSEKFVTAVFRELLKQVVREG